MSTVRARVYARVSTEDQIKNDGPTIKQSLADQVEAGKKECLKRGWHFDGAYVEPGITGETLDGRPQMMQLLADARNHAFDVLVTYHGDRIGRDMGVYMTIVQRVELLNRIPIQTLNVPRDLDPLHYDPHADDSAILHHGMQAFFGTLDQRSRTRRLRAGYVAQIKKGRYIASHLPYGYVAREHIANGYLVRAPVPDPLRYPYLALMRDMAFAGMSDRQIAYSLETEHHAPTQKGGAWLKSTVAHILTQPFYGGKIGYARTTTLHNAAKLPRKNPNADQVIYADHTYEHPWTWDEYQRLQALRQSRAARPARELASRNPLAGLLVCAHCGSSMLYRWDGRPEKTRWAFFVCGQHNANHAACVPNRLPAGPVFTDVWQEIRGIAARAEADPAAFDAAFATTAVSSERAALDARITALQNTLTALVTRETMLDTNMAKGLIPAEKYTPLLKIITDERDTTQAALATAEAARTQLDHRLGQGKAVRDAASAFLAIDAEVFTQLPHLWDQAHVFAVRDTARAIWSRIAVFAEMTDGHKTIHLDYVEKTGDD